jgi:hypothetical protein
VALTPPHPGTVFLVFADELRKLGTGLKANSTTFQPRPCALLVEAGGQLLSRATSSGISNNSESAVVVRMNSQAEGASGTSWQRGEVDSPRATAETRRKCRERPVLPGSPVAQRVPISVVGKAQLTQLGEREHRGLDRFPDRYAAVDPDLALTFRVSLLVCRPAARCRDSLPTACLPCRS